MIIDVIHKTKKVLDINCSFKLQAKIIYIIARKSLFSRQFTSYDSNHIHIFQLLLF